MNALATSTDVISATFQAGVEHLVCRGLLSVYIPPGGMKGEKKGKVAQHRLD